MPSTRKPQHLEGNEDRVAEFERKSREARPGIVREFWDFMRHEKKWWLTPIIVVMLLVGLLMLLSGTAAAPFIYPFF